jgi:two-component system, OmpR family, response regulator
VQRILVVEDEIIVGYAIREELQDLGVQVVIRDNAESALEDLAVSVFDAAILDVGLPGMRGDAFAQLCRQRHPYMPIVLATGMQQAAVRAMFAADQQVQIVMKPHDFSEVRACLERLGLVFGSSQTPLPTPAE